MAAQQFFDVLSMATLVQGPSNSTRIAAGSDGTLQFSQKGGPYQGVGTVTPAEYFQYLSAPAQELTTGAGTATNPFLNGDADGNYDIEIDLVSAVANNNIQILLNGGFINMWWIMSNALLGAQLRQDWTLTQNAAGASGLVYGVGDRISLRCQMAARSGRIRDFGGKGQAKVGGTQIYYLLNGEYNNATTNITSIGAAASQVNGLATQSSIRVIRRQSTTPILTMPVPQIPWSAWAENTIVAQ